MVLGTDWIAASIVASLLPAFFVAEYRCPGHKHIGSRRYDQVKKHFARTASATDNRIHFWKMWVERPHGVNGCGCNHRTSEPFLICRHGYQGGSLVAVCGIMFS
jgi:hypothetical protein